MIHSFQRFGKGFLPQGGRRVPTMKKKSVNAYVLTFVGVMAAMVYVVTLFRFPLLGSKVHFANAVCLLSGMLLGPWWGGLAAGLGSALYDALAGGYDFINVLITFVSKFAMAFVCGALMRRRDQEENLVRVILASVCGALTYVVLYMLKTFIYQRFVYGYPMDAVGATMVAKLVPSLINAAVAVVAAPVFYHVLRPALRSAGVWEKLRG